MSPLIVIVGETASGKSALAMELAQRFDGELVCADSWTVYRDFDIGTAKPSAAERSRVPHHLLDVADPAGGFSAPQFKELALQAITDITSRGKLPIMAGGTGLYIDSILFDYGFLEKSDPVVRDTLNAMSLERLLAQADERGLDTATIDTRNKRRVIRLIENNGAEPTRKPIRENTLVIGTATEREHLRERITKRVDVMLGSGLEHEVKKLAGMYGWEAEPMKGIGYREWREYFAGSQTIEQTRQRIIKATMDLAKRQRTWFRRLGYPASPTAKQPFLATANSNSIDVQPGTPQSPEQPVTQKASAFQPAILNNLAARNSSIQWVSDLSEADEITTTFLNKMR